MSVALCQTSDPVQDMLMDPFGSGAEVVGRSGHDEWPWFRDDTLLDSYVNSLGDQCLQGAEKSTHYSMLKVYSAAAESRPTHLRIGS